MAWTNPKTWATDEVVTAANLNTHLRDNLMSTMHVLAYKTADQTVNNSTTMVDATGLSFTVGANEVWMTHLGLFTTSNSTADFKFQYTFPSSIYSVGGLAYDTTGALGWIGNSGLPSTSATTTGAIAIAGGGNWSWMFDGLFMVGGTGGTVQLQFAQNTAAVFDTKLFKGTNIFGCRLA